MTKQLQESIYQMMNSMLKIQMNLVFALGFILFSQSILAQTSSTESSSTSRHYGYYSYGKAYTTIKNGDWNDRSTWKNSRKPPKDLKRGDQVLIYHTVNHNQNIAIKSGGTLKVFGALKLDQASIRLEKTSSRLLISKGVIILKGGNIRNQKGLVALEFGGIQICGGNYVDNTRWNGGTFGEGFIYASTGNIRNKFLGGFSHKIRWNSVSGEGINLPTEALPVLFNSLAEENCDDENFHIRFFDNDLDGIVNKYDIDDDNDGIVDRKESRGYHAFGDGDYDGIPNYLDVHDNGGYWNSNTTDYTDVNKDGIADIYDADLDGIINERDLDSDNDGIPDNIEAQTTLGYIAPRLNNTGIVDYNWNGLNDAYEVFYWYYAFHKIKPIDTDQDGTPDYLDLDTDNDGTFDIAESGSNLVDENNDGRTEGDFGFNGLISSIDNEDNYNDVNGIFDNTQFDNFLDVDDDVNLDGDVDFRDFIEALPPIITQVYTTPTDRWIEITNPSEEATIPANSIKVTLYTSLLGGIDSNPIGTYIVESPLEAGKSILISNTGATVTNVSGTPEISDLITAFDSENTLVLSNEIGSDAWESRFDIVKFDTSNSSYVRMDESTEPSPDFSEEDWVLFIDDQLNPYVDALLGGAERHPHAPLITEITTADPKANIRLGEHRFLPTEAINGTWNNGFPDRSRKVIVLENYEHANSRLSARTLEVRNDSKLTVTNQLLIVSNGVLLENASDEIRLAGTSQLIQVHEGEAGISGEGKLYIDRRSDLESIYRYNYLSSPVKSRTTSFTVKEVLKDGTVPISSTSTPLEINFIGGFDGSTTSPISIAEHWIFTFNSATGTFEQKLSEGIISPANGFLMKGTGVDQNYTYVGTPNDGILTVEVEADKFAFVGNPYPSALNARKFIEDNLEAIDGTIYLWDHVGEELGIGTSGHNVAGYIGGYATINLSMSLAANNPLNIAIDINNIIVDAEYKEPKPYLAVGQGFFVTGGAEGGTITFKNSQREYKKEGAESVFFRARHTSTIDISSAANTRSSNNILASKKNLLKEVKDEISELSVLKLGMEYVDSYGVKLHRQIGISFHQKNSFEVDLGYDSQTTDLGATDFYWTFPENDGKFIIAGVQSVSKELEIPLEIVTERTGDVSITVDEIYTINEVPYILDKVTNTYYSLEKEKATIHLTSGTHTNRFYLTFSKKANENRESTLISETSMFVDNGNKQLVVRPNNEEELREVALYNFLGRKVKDWNQIDKQSELRFPVNVPSGVYIVKLKTSIGTISKKIIIQ